MKNIRLAFIRIAHENPEVRSTLIPLVKDAAKWEKMPKGWTDESREKFWESLTGDVKHKVTKCIKEMEGKFDDPGAFCASLADRVDPGWRSRTASGSQSRLADEKEDSALRELSDAINSVHGPLSDASSVARSVSRSVKDPDSKKAVEDFYKALGSIQDDLKSAENKLFSALNSASGGRTAADEDLRAKVVRLAHEKPELLEVLLPLLKR